MASSLMTLRPISRQITIIASSSSSKWISAPMAAWINTKSSPPDSSKTGISPLLMLPPAIEEGKKKNMVYKMYSLAEKKVVSLRRKEYDEAQEFDDEMIVGSSHGWLATYNKRTHDLFLSNPKIPQHHPIKLPSLLTLPTAEKHLAANPDSRCVERVLISSRPDHEEEEEEDCRVICETKMTNYPHRYGDAGLVYCCPGRSTEWTPIGGGLYPKYRAYAYSNKHKLLFCLTSIAVLEVWDLRDLTYPRVCFEKDEEDISTHWKKVRPRSEEEQRRIYDVCRYCRYLVYSEHSDELFLVTRHIMERTGPDGSYVEKIVFGPKRNAHLDKTLVDKTVDFYVEKISGWESGDERKRDESLNHGGLSFFIGKNNSIVLPTDQFPGLEPDSIYFTDDEVNNYSTDRGTGHVGIFDYQNRTLSSPLYYPCDYSQGIKGIVPSAMWFTPSSPLLFGNYMHIF